MGRPVWLGLILGRGEARVQARGDVDVERLFLCKSIDTFYLYAYLGSEFDNSFPPNTQYRVGNEVCAVEMISDLKRTGMLRWHLEQTRKRKYLIINGLV